MMFTLYDEETIRRNREATLIRENTQKVTEKVTKSVTKSVTDDIRKTGIQRIVKKNKENNGSISDAIETAILAFDIDETKAKQYVEEAWQSL